MANIHWRSAVDGKFTKAANWRGKAAPGENDNAILDAAGNPYTVTYRTDLIGDIGGVQLASNATLRIEGRGFSTGDLVNVGTIVVNTEAGGALGFDTLVNSGTIRVDAVLATDFPAGYPDICHNGGLIEISGAPGRTVEFTMMGDGTLSGGGEIRLENGGSLNGGIINNVDNTLSGDGEIYFSGIVNEAAGVIDASDVSLLMVVSSENVITNAGTIETTGSGGATIDGLLTNTGELLASSGTLTFTQRVTGTGSAVIDGGTIDFVSRADQAVTFEGGGTLELAKSRQFTGTVTGFSSTGETTLDLGDIRFIGAGEATFSGTASGGVLTVSDGTHTAKIALAGDYLNSTFVASSDGHKGTAVIAQSANSPAATVHVFVAAMASVGPPAGQAIRLCEEAAAREPLIASPRVALA